MNETLNISHLQNGMYIIELITESREDQGKTDRSIKNRTAEIKVTP